MKTKFVVIVLVAIFFFPCTVSAGTSTLTNEIIQYVEMYPGQFSVVFSVNHGSPGCGNPNRIAVDVNTQDGRAQQATLLAAFVTEKPVNIVITDAQCLGDRPTIVNFGVSK